MTNPKLLGSQYVIEKELESGTFGKVYQVICKKTSKTVAVKIIDNVSEALIQNNIKEVSLLQTISDKGFHESSLLKFYHSFEFDSRIAIVTEELYIDLFNYMNEYTERAMKLSSVRKIGYQVLNGIYHLNLLGFAHTDIKLENIMFVNRCGPDPFAIKIIDFGGAYPLDELEYAVEEHLSSTIRYRSPEILFGLQLDRKVDIWCTGIVLFELYTGMQLFTTDDKWHLIKQIDKIIGLNDFIERYGIRGRPANVKPKLDYNQRGFTKLHKHGYNSREGTGVTKEDHQFASLLKNLLSANPFERLSVEQAMNHDFFTNRSIRRVNNFQPNSINALQRKTTDINGQFPFSRFCEIRKFPNISATHLLWLILFSIFVCYNCVLLIN